MSCRPNTLANNRVTGLPPDAVIFGKSSPMLKLEGRIRRLLGTNLPIVLQGESGTGKSILSKFIHNNSVRITGSYFRVNCADEGTLFEPMTSTTVEEANPNCDSLPVPQIDLSGIGTLFLDEVGELLPKQQMQLLQLLPDQQDFGDWGRPNPWAKTRIIGATGRNLRQEVKDKRFRRDLLYRLAVVILEVPPLRDRLDDLVMIANYLRQRYSETFGLLERPFPEKLIERMRSYGWPDNIRELENFVCHYVVLGHDERALLELIGSGVGALAADAVTPGETQLREVSRRARVTVEREMIVKALNLNKGSLKRAACALGISYRTLINKMDQVGLPRVRYVLRSRADLKGR